jgi:hypothetical protein
MEPINRSQFTLGMGHDATWRRAMQIAHDHFPLAYAEVYALATRGAVLDSYPNDGGDGYYIDCPAVRGRKDLDAVWAATAQDRKEWEIATARELAGIFFDGTTGLQSASLAAQAEGFGVAAFDERFAELTDEHQKRAARKRRRGWPRGFVLKSLRGRAARKAARKAARMAYMPPDKDKDLGDNWQLLVGDPRRAALPPHTRDDNRRIVDAIRNSIDEGRRPL